MKLYMGIDGGTTALHSSIALQQKHPNEGIDGVQLPERSVHLRHPRRRAGKFSRRSKPFLLQDQNYEPFRKDCAITKRTQSTPSCRKCTKQKYSFSPSQFCVCERPAMRDATGKSSTTWKVAIDNMAGTITSKEIHSKFLECEFHVNPSETPMQLLEAITQHVSETNDSVGQECMPVTYPSYSIFIRDDARRLKPG